MKRNLIVGYTPKKHVFGDFTREEGKLFTIANKYMTQHGVRVGTIVGVDYIEKENVLVVTRPDNFLGL